MAEGDRPHFKIPPELTYSDPIRRTGFSSTIERADYAAHGQILVRRAQQLRAASAEYRDSTAVDQLFLQLTVAEQTTIRAEKGRLRQSGIEVVSYSPDDERVGTARLARAGLDDLEGRLSRYATVPDHPGKSYFAAVEDFGPIPAQEKIAEELKEADVEAVDAILYLFPGLSDREISAVVGEMETFIVDRGGEFKGSHRFSSGLTTVRAILARDQLEEIGHDFSTLRRIAPNRTFFVQDTTPYTAIPNPIAVAPPATNYGVAVVDSGVTPRCALLSPTLVGTMLALPPGAVAPLGGHGTFVASRTVYGDDLEAQLRNPPVVPSCRVMDVPIFGVDGSGRTVHPDEHDLAVALDTVLPALPAEIRVVNLSLGTDHPIQDHQYSLVASTLDHLAREHDLLVVTTAGNVRERVLISGFPASLADPGFRIDPPGESLLALTVGAIAKFGDGSTFAQRNELSPFSRVGPGADGGMKPEVVSHGGNYMRPGVPHSRFATQGIHGDGRHLAWDNGTSFAAPLVASLAAQIHGAYGGLPANLVKGLLCHFTRSCCVPGGSTDVLGVGLGEPVLGPALQAGANSAGFLYVGDLGVESYLHVPFFVPDALSGERRDSRLRVRATVVYDPPVDPNNPTEYSRSRISVTLRKPLEVGFREVALSSSMKTYRPWNPVIHFDKRFSRSYRAGQWELRLRLYTRDLDETFRQSFAAVIEVIDDNGGVDVWNDVRAETDGAYEPMTIITAAA